MISLLSKTNDLYFAAPECPNPGDIVELLTDGDDAFSIRIEPNPLGSNPLDGLRGTGMEILVDQNDEFIIKPDSFSSPFRVMVVQLVVRGASEVTVTLVDEDSENEIEVCYTSFNYTHYSKKCCLSLMKCH